EGHGAEAGHRFRQGREWSRDRRSDRFGRRRTQGATEEQSAQGERNERTSSNVREVLECASPLALSEAWWVRKRQRTAALQDAGARLIALFNNQPFIGSEHLQSLT